MSIRARSIINVGGLVVGLIIALGIVAGGGAFTMSSPPTTEVTAATESGAAGESEAVAEGDTCCPVEGEPAAASVAGFMAKADAASAETRDRNRAWCAEHDTYEDICPICRGTGETPDPARDPDRPWCAEHEVYEDACAICNGVSMASLEPGQGMLIRLRSGESLDKAAIETARPGAGEAVDAAGYVCRVMYNENRFAHIVPSVGGIVTSVHVDLGQHVAAGDPIVTISSPDVATAQATYAEAVALHSLAAEEFAREKTLHEREISAARDFQAAQTALTTAQVRVDGAKQQLSLLGLEQGPYSGDGELVLHAPFAGTIVDRHAVVGEAVDRGAALASVADLEQMWVEVSIPPGLSSSVRNGSAVQARFSDLSGLVLEGTVDWISPQIDVESRTLRVRAVVPNPGGVLKANMFGRASFQGVAAAGVVLVPADAVQYHEGEPLIFVRQADDLVEVRSVDVGARHGDRLEIRTGLDADEELVVARAYTLKSEMLKARLGAGCTDH